MPFVILVNIVCILIYFLSFHFDVSVLGFSATTDLSCRLTYIFAHVGLTHLLFNLFAFDMFYRLFFRLNIREGLVVAFVSAILATFGSEYTMVTIGLSGVVYAMIGVTTYFIRTKNWYLTLLTLLVANTITVCFANINWKLHLLSFIYGLVLTFIIEYGKRKRTTI